VIADVERRSGVKTSPSPWGADGGLPVDRRLRTLTRFGAPWSRGAVETFGGAGRDGEQRRGLQPGWHRSFLDDDLRRLPSRHVGQRVGRDGRYPRRGPADGDQRRRLDHQHVVDRRDPGRWWCDDLSRRRRRPSSSSPSPPQSNWRTTTFGSNCIAPRQHTDTACWPRRRQRSRQEELARFRACDPGADARPTGR